MDHFEQTSPLPVHYQYITSTSDTEPHSDRARWRSQSAISSLSPQQPVSCPHSKQTAIIANVRSIFYLLGTTAAESTSGSGPPPWWGSSLWFHPWQPRQVLAPDLGPAVVETTNEGYGNRHRRTCPALPDRQPHQTALIRATGACSRCTAVQKYTNTH